MMTSSQHQSFKPRRIKTTTAAKPPQPPVLKCPRCDSVNTKFCYYNNYSLSQPRHYCKNCRRYWTRGGSLRNVPIGGSTRNKNKPPTTSNVMTSSSPSMMMMNSGGLFSGYMFPLDPNYHNLLASSSSIESLSSLNQDMHQKLQQQRLITTTTSMFLQDSLPVNDKPVTFIPPSTTTTEWVFDRSVIGEGGATSGSIENNRDGEGNFGIWYQMPNNALH